MLEYCKGLNWTLDCFKHRPNFLFTPLLFSIFSSFLISFHYSFSLHPTSLLYCPLWFFLFVYFFYFLPSSLLPFRFFSSSPFNTAFLLCLPSFIFPSPHPFRSSFPFLLSSHFLSSYCSVHFLFSSILFFSTLLLSSHYYCLLSQAPSAWLLCRSRK